MIGELLSHFRSKSERRKARAVNKAIAKWAQRHYSEQSPQFIKEALFLKYGIKDAYWIESGTYLGTTTKFLAEHFPLVHSIEPEPRLYEQAVEKFAGQNVQLYKGTSEEVFPTLLPKLKGKANFWLDGHYSAGITFRGNKDCPVEDELDAISKNLGNFDRVLIMIDDVRCFLPENQEKYGYPSVNRLFEWAERHGLYWRIEHDIFIIGNSSSDPIQEN